MDGLKLYVEKSLDNETQNIYYNGWQHNHYVTNIFVFMPDGFIRSYIINCPGNTHDSLAAEYGYIYQKLGEHSKSHRGKCVADSAFCRKR